jgi:hypothetical protein
MPDSINWLARLRSDKILQIEDFLNSMEARMFGDSSPHVDIQNFMDLDNCDRSVEDEVVSSDF